MTPRNSVPYEGYRTTFVLQKYASCGDALRVVEAAVAAHVAGLGPILVVYEAVSGLTRRTLRDGCPAGTRFAAMEAE